MPDLRSELSAIASRFADDVLAAIRSASLDDLLAEDAAGPRRGRRPRAAAATPAPHVSTAPTTRKPKIVGGKLARRSAADIEKALGLVVAALKATKSSGMRSEEIQKVVGLDKRELPRVLRMGLAKKALRSKGEKRARKYFPA
jgi:hypothetical protein